MRSLLVLYVATVWLLGDNMTPSISPITPAIKTRMIAGKIWHPGCPVAPKSLRYLRLPYHGFDGKDRLGEMIVHHRIAREVVTIFQYLYMMHYPIRRMELVSNFGGSDWRSIEADNTSAFHCRRVSTGTGKWSRHAYGMAIDLNPIENPFVTRRGTTLHPRSYPFLRRRQRHTGVYATMLDHYSDVVAIFNRYGWVWGGTFSPYRDYQHIEKPAAP